MGLAVGIDLGTTNCAVAWLGQDGKPVVLPSAEGRPITPSVLCFKDGEILVGDAAKDLQRLGTWPIAAFFKRQMGDPLFLFHAAGVDYTATDLSALLLRKLKADAEVRAGETITHAVITVPAYFRDGERKATIAAGAAAGLEVLQVINEPTAAAVAYAVQRSEIHQNMLVYDLGGGTFDITLLGLSAEGVQVKISDGDHQLGGKDWDERVIEYLADQFRNEFGVDPLEDSDSLADLLVLAEDAKKRLTSMTSATLTLKYAGHTGRYVLERAKFEELTADLMERTVSLTRRVLEDAHLETQDIHGVLLVGGSTRMPMVHAYVTKTFGKPPMGGVNVDEAVALGAAVVAGGLKPRAGVQFRLSGRTRTVDVTNHSLGMIAINPDQSAYVNSPILPKNRVVPCVDTRPYQHRTRRGGDNLLEVYMTQGESEGPGEVSYIGRYAIHGIPHDPKGISIIHISYHYDASATVQVTATVAGDARPLAVTVEPLPPDVPARFLEPPERHKIQHVTAYLAFDLSGSMSDEPLRNAKSAAHGFLTKTDLSHCSVGIMAFSDRVLTKLAASQNARNIERAIDGLTVGETGGCNGAEPFSEGLAQLQSIEGRRFFIVLTDGAWSRQGAAIEAARRCHAADIEVIAVGFGSADQAFLKAVASSDEGSFFTSMSGLVETFSNIAQVLTELRHPARPRAAACSPHFVER